MSKNVICIAEGCRKKLRGRQTKFCSGTCQKRQFARDKRHNDKVDTKPINKEYNADTGDYASVRRGQYYRAFVSEGIAEEVASGDMTVANAASLLGCTPATVSRMLAAYKIDSRNEIAAEEWELSADAEAALENFSNFRHKYFRTELGKHYDTAEFHTNWINNIIDSIEHGKELLILSPPTTWKDRVINTFCCISNM